MSEFKYKKYQQDVTLLKGIDDIWPYQLHLPGCPPIETITGYGKHPSEQVFQRVQVPPEIKKLNQLSREKAIEAAANSLEITTFIAKMWYHRMYGDFQFINGEPIHISPTYWFYLNFWKMDVGLPKFRYDKNCHCTDLWKFAFWDYIVQPTYNCYGFIEGTKRRGGKTFSAMCMAYNRVSFHRKRRASIQSKTNDDAIDAFKEKMVECVLELPFFFKPYQANHTIPKAEGFRFEPKSRSGNNLDEEVIDTEDYLFSWIKYYNANAYAADGKKWHVHVSDEDGKADKEVDVWERHQVIKPCLTEESDVIGKEIATTTVEDMDKTGADRFLYKWRRSNRNPNLPEKERMVNENGETDSGLFQWFQPTSHALVWDKFGCAIVDTPTKEQQEWLKNIKRDPEYMKGGQQRIKERIDNKKNQQDKFSEMRKFPETVKDMFITATGFCHFDLGILTRRLQDLAYGNESECLRGKMIFINFHWKNNIKNGTVEFTHADPDDVIWWLSYLPKQELWNNFYIDQTNGRRAPGNWNKFASGCDPFKFDTDEVIHKDEMSIAAAHIWSEYDESVDPESSNPENWLTGDITGEAYFRGNMSVDEMCEQFAMACIFFGMKMLPEKNNKEVINYFKREGLENYLEFDKRLAKTDLGVFLKDTSAGSNTDVASVQAMFRAVQRYVKERGLRCKFWRTLRQLTDVNPVNMTKRDLFVSLAKTLQVVYDFNPIRRPDDDADVDISDIMAGLRTLQVGYDENGGTDNFYSDN